MKISRRAMLSGGGLLIFAGLAMPEALRSGRASARGFPFMLSDEQWRKRLSTRQYAILRKEATEPPFASPLNNEHRKGVFLCAGCGQRHGMAELLETSARRDQHRHRPQARLCADGGALCPVWRASGPCVR